MPDYHDPVPRARAALVALGVFIAAQAAQIAVALAASAEADAQDISALVLFAAMIAALIAVSCWVYRVNGNAHSFADGLSITPGWNVGWFFVPIANLWKPFEGIREAWQASHDPADWPWVPVPALLRVWWGCWLAGNILSNLSFQISRATGTFTNTSAVDLIASAVLIASAALLMRIVAVLSRRQRQTHVVQAFA